MGFIALTCSSAHTAAASVLVGENRNPYSPENEGFLAWLWVVGNQTDAPHVYSLSYADIEAAVFNASTPGAEEYAYR